MPQLAARKTRCVSEYLNEPPEWEVGEEYCEVEEVEKVEEDDEERETGGRCLFVMA